VLTLKLLRKKSRGSEVSRPKPQKVVLKRLNYLKSLSFWGD